MASPLGILLAQSGLKHEAVPIAKQKEKQRVTRGCFA